MEKPEMRTVELERFKLVAYQYISQELMEHFAERAKVEVCCDIGWMFDTIVLTVVQEVYGREIDRIECKWPANWWHAFKDRWFPEWAKKRWPVRWHKCSLTAKELYPRIAMPEREHYITLHKSEFDPTWYDREYVDEGE